MGFVSRDRDPGTWNRLGRIILGRLGLGQILLGQSWDKNLWDSRNYVDNYLRHCNAIDIVNLGAAGCYVFVTHTR